MLLPAMELWCSGSGSGAGTVAVVLWLPSKLTGIALLDEDVPHPSGAGPAPSQAAAPLFKRLFRLTANWWSLWIWDTLVLVALCPS